MFNPSRLRVARKRCKLNKTRLAELIGVDPRSVSAYERGEYEPSAETLAELTRVLKFPAGFFAAADLHEPSAITASFRSMARMSASNREAALAVGALAIDLDNWIGDRFTLPTSNLPDLTGEDPETAAMTMRQHWGLGERPIRNMIHLLESMGIRIFSMVEDTTEVDAFSYWHDARPFIFLNTLKSAERGRFDAGHELGHLVLHRHGGPQGKEAESEANRFASAFLMPRASILGRVPAIPSLGALVSLKQHWIVSVVALAYRLHVLGVLTDWHYRALCVEMAQLGYRAGEPAGAPREMSMILPKILSALRAEGMTKFDLAAEMQIDAEELDKLVFGLILVSLGGGSISTTRSARSLHLVK